MASRSELKKFVYNSKVMTFNDLKKLVDNIKNLNTKSKVNPNTSRKYVIEEIFKPFFSNLESKGFNLNSVVETTMFTSKDKLTLSKHGLIMLNILSECDFNPKKEG